LVVGQAFFLGRGLREELLSIQEKELARGLALAPAFLLNLGPVEPDSASRALATRIGYPVTLLDEEGVVVGASGDLPFQRKGSAWAPDDAEARHFAGVGVRLANRDLVLQVAAPLNGIERSVRTQFRKTMAMSLPALALALALTLLLGSSMEGSLRSLSRSLRARFQELEGERDEMQGLMDSMGEAVLSLDRKGNILRTNRAAIEMLGFPDPVPSVPVRDLVRHPTLSSLLESAMKGPYAAQEIEVGDRHLMVSAMMAEGGGAVITLHDVSELRRLEVVRRDFVANASHEMKTPLTAIRGFAETLLEDDPPPELRRQFLGSVKSNTLRIQSLVDDLLDLSRLESGGWVARVEEVELRPLVEDLMENLLSRSSSRDLDVSVLGNAWVWGDHQGVIQVLGNLLNNAEQYTPDGGAIVVEVKKKGDRAQIEVRDTGIGIPAPALPRVFERFFRVDPARSRSVGGTGLGLAIVRHLVEAMDGRVWAESEPGDGTSIFFTLPLSSGKRSDL
jgi:two-component system phosphate regulon sensor histidine kinase PhoR